MMSVDGEQVVGLKELDPAIHHSMNHV